MSGPSNKRAKTDQAGDGRVKLEGGFTFPTKTITRWRESQFCDVSVRVHGNYSSRTFEVHRLVLDEGSDYFSSLFGQRGGAFPDSDSKIVDLPDMEPDVFECVLEFMYCGSVEAPEANLGQVLEAAARLQILSLMSAAKKAAKNSMTTNNCLSLWDLAERLNLRELEEAAKEEALCRFQEIASLDEFQNLPLPKLRLLLSSDALKVESEEELYDTVRTRWLDKQQPELAPKDALDLLGLFRYPLMTDEFANGILQKARKQGDHEFCALLCKSFMNSCYGNAPTPRSARSGTWCIPQAFPKSIKDAIEIKGNDIEMCTQCIVLLRKLLFQGMGIWDVTMKLLADDSSYIGDACSCFGFITPPALKDIVERLSGNRNFLADTITGTNGFNGVWMLRRYCGEVYSEENKIGEVGRDDFSFPLDAEVRMRLDTNACTAEFFVNDVPVLDRVQGIRMPVLPFVLSYLYVDMEDISDFSDPVKVRLVRIANA